MTTKYALPGAGLFLCLLFASCKALPPPAAEAPVLPAAEEAAAEEAPPGTGGEGLVPEEEPAEAEFSPEEPPAGIIIEALEEPPVYLAEAHSPDAPPPEEELSAALPEPALPRDFPAAPEDLAAGAGLGDAADAEAPGEAAPEPDVAAARPESPGAAAPPVGPPLPLGPPESPAVPPAVPPAAPPEPPRFIRPAEPLPSPPPGREPAAVPPNPPPEPPASPPPALGEAEVLYSRIVRMTVGQTLEVPFRGTGWVYLGELDSRRGISYLSRRADDEGQSFILRAEEPGTFGLKFYKQDYIRDYILNDYVQVVVAEAPEAGTWLSPPVEPGRVVASPRWPRTGDSFLPGEGVNLGEGISAGPGQPPARPPAGPYAGPPVQAPGQAASPVLPSASAAEDGAAPAVIPPPARSPLPRIAPPDVSPVEPPAVSSAGPTAGPTARTPPLAPARPRADDDGVIPVAPPVAAGGPARPPAPGPSAGSAETEPDGYLRRVREEYEAGRVREALDLLDQFRARFPAGSDEAWWLYGQLLEAEGPGRDIRSALDYYRRLTREYPQSPRYAEARRRIAYLERYYFNIQ